MIQITQIKINMNQVGQTKELELQAIKKKVLKLLYIEERQLSNLVIVKKSIDARKKNEICYIYTVKVEVLDEKKIVNRINQSKNKNNSICLSQKKEYEFKPTGTIKQKTRPIIVGFGPSGMFCALLLAEQGYKPIVLERGAMVEERIRDIAAFWDTNLLKPNSNVQFGEGGAGTFSDGKLNTLVKDELGRNQKVLEVFVENGAPSEILYLNKPHIGTDNLRAVVKSIRQRIIELGGEIRFHNTLTDIFVEHNQLKKIEVNHCEEISCETLILALGHSARDTFELLYQKGFELHQKAFAIGVRIEHPQEMISLNQYGDQYEKLPASDYKLTYQASNQRSIYSFCMCPGGYVVNASSEEEQIAINGMSFYKRDGKNANSALVVAVGPQDFESDLPLAGMEFQRKWERLAFQTGEGSVPVQLYGDLCANRVSTGFGSIQPSILGKHKFGDLTTCLPPYVIESIKEGMTNFDKKIPGFAREDAVLSGVETRTSSPVRINRDEVYESNIKGVYPCGEGAGYAGGIMSAAMDGIKIFEAIATKFKR